MKIKDIRLFKSEFMNADRRPLPKGLTSRRLYVITRRILLKLRENNFSLGEFDHLYLNFTPVIPEGEIAPAKRTVSESDSWFRFYDIGISQEQFDHLEEPEQEDLVFDRMQETLLKYFAGDDLEPAIRESVKAALEQGADMKMVYKTKQAQNHTAVLYLRFLDNGQYYPLLCVYDAEDKPVLEQDMDPIWDLSTLGEIKLARKRVSIYPRQTAKSKTFRPQSYEFE